MRKPCGIFSVLVTMNNDFHNIHLCLRRDMQKIAKSRIVRIVDAVTWNIVKCVFIMLLVTFFMGIVDSVGNMSLSALEASLPSEMLASGIIKANIGFVGAGALTIVATFLILFFFVEACIWCMKQYEFAKLYKKHQLN